MVLITSTGVVLEENDMTKILDRAAQKYKLPIRAFLAIHPHGDQEYVLIEKQKPIYASPKFEFVAAKLDMLHYLALTKQES